MKQEKTANRKIIHYCWFGNTSLPDSAKRCIRSWKKFFPDYEIKEWNEKNFDVNCNRYVSEAYDNKKYAFVSDYARLKIIYDEGGVYFDTDVEVIKRFPDELLDSGFFGLEDGKIATGLGFCAKRNDAIIKALMDDYEKIGFINDGKMDLTSCVDRNTLAIKALKYDIKPFFKIGNITVCPEEFFNPMDYKTGKMTITNNTYSIHHYDATWTSLRSKQLKAIKYKLISKYGVFLGKTLYCFAKINIIAKTRKNSNK